MWFEKATHSLESARLLLASDPDSACSRAYYAMFYAARAALLHAGAAEAAMSRTHSGLIGAFGERLIKPGLLAREHGRAFSKVAQERLVADYSGDGVTKEAAEAAIARAAEFLGAVESWLAMQAG